MELSINEEILLAYGFNLESIKLQQIGSGHINQTYLLTTQNEHKFIIQQINTTVFKDPQSIANNIKAIADYLKITNPDYLFPAPINTLSGELMFHIEDEYWRLMPFVSNTIAYDTLSEPKQAFEAAKQFGKLTRLLKDFNPSILKPTISGFHDLNLRYEQFTFALDKTNKALKDNAAKEIETTILHHFIVDYYKSYENSKNFPNRVMHHDTKISNVLLDKDTNDGFCVIDLDTLMPGKFISDLGDMMRTYLCAFSENETDLSKINIRLDYFEATVKGYLSEMASILTDTEKDLILFSGKYIIYMQAIRFLTDYLNGSVYYPIAYPEQNLDRAKNQFKLLSKLFEHDKILQDIIEDCL